MRTPDSLVYLEVTISPVAFRLPPQVSFDTVRPSSGHYLHTPLGRYAAISLISRNVSSNQDNGVVIRQIWIQRDCNNRHRHWTQTPIESSTDL